MKYAVIKTGGKEYKAQIGATLKVEKLAIESGNDVEFDSVLMTVDGDNINIGAPFLSGIKVKATVSAHGRGEKIRVIKFKRRKGYKRTQGHRQDFTEVKINDIVAISGT